MLNIGDFARLARVSVRMLRHYDQLGLLCPTSVNPHTGYRQYHVTQLHRANELVALKDMGFRLDDVGTMLDSDGAHTDLVALLEQRRNELRAQLEADGTRLAAVEAKLHQMKKEKLMSAHIEIEEHSLPALRLAQKSVRITDMSQIGAEIGLLFEEVNAAIDTAAATRTGPGVAHYTGDDESITIAAAEQVAAGPAPDGLDVQHLQAEPLAVVTSYEGSDLDGLPAAWQALVTEAAHRGLQTHGTCREIYHRTPYDPEGGDSGDGAWLISLQQPVTAGQ